jgi:hypothetical protein
MSRLKADYYILDVQHNLSLYKIQMLNIYIKSLVPYTLFHVITM